MVSEPVLKLIVASAPTLYLLERLNARGIVSPNLAGKEALGTWDQSAEAGTQAEAVILEVLAQ